MMIALCGCMMQEPHVVEKLKKSYSFVDLIFGTHNIYKFPELIATALDSKRMVIDIWKDTDQIVEDLPSERKYPFKSGCPTTSENIFGKFLPQKSNAPNCHSSK